MLGMGPGRRHWLVPTARRTTRSSRSGRKSLTATRYGCSFPGMITLPAYRLPVLRDGRHLGVICQRWFAHAGAPGTPYPAPGML